MNTWMVIFYISVSIIKAVLVLITFIITAACIKFNLFLPGPLLPQRFRYRFNRRKYRHSETSPLKTQDSLVNNNSGYFG